MTKRSELLKQHYASITDEVERRAFDGEDPEAFDGDGDYVGAMRECACGELVNGYYEYTDHLIKVLEEAGL